MKLTEQQERILRDFDALDEKGQDELVNYAKDLREAREKNGTDAA